VFSIPSHDPAQARLLNTLVRTHVEAIRSRSLLIVDLRGNEGGGAFTTRSLHPFIVTTELRPTPYDSGAAVMLSSPAQITYARRFTGTDTSAFVRSLVARLEANAGSLVPLEETPPPSPPPAEPSVAGNWRVVVLVDRGTISAAEVLVLRALRSARAVVVGEPTAGALDYQSVQVLSLGTGYPRWSLGYPTITAHADLPRRGMRGKGIQPQVHIDWTTLADPIAEVERRFAP
jgi:C-terminal processing protease CtpA/Prc